MQSSSDHKIQTLEKEGHLRQFNICQRVHSVGKCRRIGTVKYVGPVEGYSGNWVGVDWDNGDGKHDGFVNGVSYFQARSPKSASFVRPHNLSTGISLLQALQIRYGTTCTKEEEDEMYVFSTSNKRVSVQLLGKDKIEDKLSKFEELTSASLFYLGISSPGDPFRIRMTLPNLKEIDLTGNLLWNWQDVECICRELPSLVAVNLSNNIMSQDIVELSPLNKIRILVLNNTGVIWSQVEALKNSFPSIEELYLMGNNLRNITLTSSIIVQGFDSLQVLNLEDNNLTWDEILKLSQLRRLKQLHLNKNKVDRIWYPKRTDVLSNDNKPFRNLRCLLFGGNNIGDLRSIDSLNCFPSLVDVRLSENPISDPGRGGIPRFVLIARLRKIEILNGSEITSRERKDSEIRYVRLVMTKLHCSVEDIKMLHPRFAELKAFHGIEDENISYNSGGPQKMASGLISLTLKCVGPSIGEKPLLTKKLPATITVGRLKTLCENFFKLKSIEPKLFLQEGSLMPTLLDDDMSSLIDLGVGNDSTILIDEDD